MCALLFLVSVAILSPASAEEDAAGLFGALSDLFKRPEDSTARVPKRRKTVESSTAVVPDGASEPEESVEPLPASPRVAVPKRRQAETARPAPPPTAPAVEPAEHESPELAAARAPIDVPERREGVQPSHVFRAVRDLISEIDILREALNVRDYPPEAELVEDRAPIHVYAKSLEVLTKVVGAQRRMGVPAGRVGRIPFRAIDDADVLVQIELLLVEIRRIKAHMSVDRSIRPARLEPGTTSSMVYKSLADASFMLDGLRGRPVTPDDVYRNTLSIHDEVALIAEWLDVPLDLASPRVEGTKKPVDVALQFMRAAYKALSLQARLQMNASDVPTVSLVRVTPSENLDVTYTLLAELARIRLHLGIDVPRTERQEQPQGKRPGDVFALAALIDRNLDRLAAVASR